MFVQLPPDLAERVGSYTHEMFLLTKGFDISDTLSRLPPNLQAEIQLCLHQKLLKKVSKAKIYIYHVVLLFKY